MFIAALRELMEWLPKIPTREEKRMAARVSSLVDVEGARNAPRDEFGRRLNKAGLPPERSLPEPGEGLGSPLITEYTRQDRWKSFSRDERGEDEVEVRQFHHTLHPQDRRHTAYPNSYPEMRERAQEACSSLKAARSNRLGFEYERRREDRLMATCGQIAPMLAFMRECPNPDPTAPLPGINTGKMEGAPPEINNAAREIYGSTAGIYNDIGGCVRYFDENGKRGGGPGESRLYSTLGRLASDIDKSMSRRSDLRGLDPDEPLGYQVGDRQDPRRWVGRPSTMDEKVWTERKPSTPTQPGARR